MFDNDDAARRALRTLTDEPAPPVTTSFEQVLRRGRRRVFIQRASTVASVVAVVAAIGVGAVLLRQGDPSGGVQVGDTSTTSPPSTAPSPSAFAELDGWEPVAMPPGADGEGSGCVSQNQGTPRPDVALPSRAMVTGAFLDAVKAAVGEAPTTPLAPNWQENSEKFEQARGAVAVEVGMDNGNGQVQLEVSPYSDQPEVAANRANTVYGNCEPPYRHVLDDGTVLQIYQVDTFDPKAPTQALRIYRPDGFLYVITAAGYSESDFVEVPDSSAKALEGGRGKLPTSTRQLATIAERLVTELGG